MSKKISELSNKTNLSLKDRLTILEELYWADWNELSLEDIDIIFEHLSSDDLGIQEMSKTLSLYNNISGAYIEKFAHIIANYYINDRIKFFKALNLNRDEAIYLVYIFMSKNIFEDEEKEYKEIESTNQLSDEELEAAQNFFTMYKTICNT
mgnify:CR=1 FL=1